MNITESGYHHYCNRCKNTFAYMEGEDVTINDWAGSKKCPECGKSDKVTLGMHFSFSIDDTEELPPNSIFSPTLSET